MSKSNASPDAPKIRQSELTRDEDGVPMKFLKVRLYIIIYGVSLKRYERMLILMSNFDALMRALVYLIFFVCRIWEEDRFRPTHRCERDRLSAVHTWHIP